MEHLKHDLRAMISHIDELITKFGEPPRDALISKVNALAASLEKDSINVPSRIRTIIYDSFQNILGYIINYKKIKSSTQFNAGNLLLTLKTISQHMDEHITVVIPTQEELSNISLAATKLWELDSNRAHPEKDYIIDLQEGKNMWENIDNPNPLFSFVDEKLFERPTYKAFRSLLDNYHSSLGNSESFSDDQKKEISTFLNHCGQTPIFQYLHQYLLLTNKIKSRTMNDFLSEVHKLWFDLYSRHGKNDSSGFEHVFVGEIKDDEVTGLHNWIQIYLEERKQKFNYKGFIKPNRKASFSSGVPTGNSQLINIGFDWNGYPKKISSSFIGVSPEFELALYTLINYILAGENKTEIDLKIAFYVVKITCFPWKQGNNTYIATSFPSIPPLSQDEAASKIQARARGNQIRKGTRR